MQKDLDTVREAILDLQKFDKEIKSQNIPYAGKEALRRALVENVVLASRLAVEAGVIQELESGAIKTISEPLPEEFNVNIFIDDKFVINGVPSASGGRGESR